MKRASALAAGLLFGVGLGVSGMTDPARVRGFLDVADFDPTLAFVMMGALLVHAPLAYLVRKRAAPLFDSAFHLPTRKDIDARLLIGASLFGVGWGLAGVCPGPAFALLATFAPTVALFVIAMFAGMAIARPLVPKAR